jgi:hypothetical protein
METTITNHLELLQQLSLLKIRKGLQEEIIKESFNHISSSLSLLSVFKKATKQERFFDIAKFGAGMVLDFIVDQLMFRSPQLKTNLNAAKDDKHPTIQVINNLLNIISSVSLLISKINQHNDISK